MQTFEIIKRLGLTDNEAKVYLAGLELGQATIQELGRKSGVKRTTVYSVVEGLKEKGLLSQTKKGKKTLLVFENPDGLLDLSLRRHQALKEALPEIKSIYNISTKKPKLKFYEGREGYLAVYENILKEKPKELLAVSSYNDFLKHVDWSYERQWTERRINLGIRLRWLDFKTSVIEKLAKEGARALREIRYLPKNFHFTSIMFLYNNKMLLLSGQQKEFSAVLIEDSEFCQMFKQLFEVLWQSQAR